MRYNAPCIGDRVASTPHGTQVGTVVAVNAVTAFSLVHVRWDKFAPRVAAHLTNAMIVIRLDAEHEMNQYRMEG